MTAPARGRTGLLWAWFPSFIGSTDRFERLRSIVSAAGLAESGDRHIVRVANAAGRPCPHFLISAETQHLERKPPAVLLAHYDAAEGSPGANDNAAAVFMLLGLAQQLRREHIPDWLIIFTGGEELARGESVTNQGSYTLARCFARTSLASSRFFILDCMGRGDTVVISTTAGLLARGSTAGAAAMAHKTRALRERALAACARAGQDRVLLLPAPFSDDAGFLRAGLAAQTITVLPHAEAQTVLASSRRGTYGGRFDGARPPASNSTASSPETWRLINTPQDTSAALTPQNFVRMERVMEELVKAR
jgi:hypothetical protein